MSKRIKIALAIIILSVLGSAIFLIIKFHSKNEDSKDVKERVSECEMEEPEKDLPPLEVDESKDSRRLFNVEFKNFKIYIDLAYMTYQASLDQNLSKNFNRIQKSMEKAKSTLENLFMVKPFEKNWVVRAEIIQHLGIPKYNENYFKKKGEPTQNLKQIGNDLYIFPKFGNISSMGSWGIYYKDSNNRPMITKMTFSTKFNFEKNGADKYLDIFFLHYFTHLLGFSGTYIKENFPGNPYLIKKDKFNIERHYITSKKVIETAKKYFGCDSISGVELDNKGIINGVSTHWEPRILLGDYMASFGIEYEEQAISEITLSLMEDSGWYKANYYTGGLMRFGKNKGCDFIYEKCVNQKTHKTNFKNEFFDELYNDKITPSCSSGRQSRNYKIFYQFSSTIPQEFQYFEKPKKGGSSLYADYCPIMDSIRAEMENDFYVGNCRDGSNIYGYNARYKNFKNNKYYYGINNTKLPEDFGESLNKDNSFCVINSLVLKTDVSKYKYNFVAPRAMCHEMICSDRTLTIKINNEYIICPRQGGKVEVEGYDGFILCPDYNLICTGSVMCNDLFDCVEKKSLVKEPLYDYEIKTSQDYGKEEKSNAIEGYEESSNGFCPKDCGRCNEKKECLKLKKHCNKIDPNCDECTDDNKICNKCKNNLYLYQNKCYEIKTSVTNRYNKVKSCSSLMTGCNRCITENVCVSCNYGYGLDFETRKCKTLKSLEKDYYFDNRDSTYKKCDYGVPNCLYCSNSNYCYRCKKGYFLIEIGKDDYDHTKCYTYNDLQNKFEFYNKNTTHRPLCSSKIDGCYSCNTMGTICKSCLDGYQWYKRKNCILSSQINNQCSRRFPHCLQCNSNQCLKCSIGYTHQKKERYGRCFPTPKNNEYYYDTTLNVYTKCLDSPYLERCLRCTDAKTCIECDTKAHILKDNKCYRVN